MSVYSGGMGGNSRIIPIEQFSKANQRLNKQHAGQGSSHQGTSTDKNERVVSYIVSFVTDD